MTKDGEIWLQGVLSAHRHLLEVVLSGQMNDNFRAKK